MKTVSVINHTPFPAIAFRQYNLKGELNGVISVCGAFHLVENGSLCPVSEQPPLVLEDCYADDPRESVQIRQGALTPFKPSTDITLIGNTYAPNGQAQVSWLCGLRVGENKKIVRVTGPRHWLPHVSAGCLANWYLEKPIAVKSVSLDWRYAWGGKLPQKTNGQMLDVHRYNPVGCGIVDLQHFDSRIPIPAPQIEDPDDPISDWNRDYIPQGFAPISPWWQPRQQYAGTYDENWKNVRRPLLPADFDYRFYQSAPPDLITKSYLKGDEQIELLNLTPPASHLISQLPGINLGMRIRRYNNYTYGRLVLDGVHFDFRPSAPKRVFLSWRTSFPWGDGKGLPELALID